VVSFITDFILKSMPVHFRFQGAADLLHRAGAGLAWSTPSLAPALGALVRPPQPPGERKRAVPAAEVHRRRGPCRPCLRRAVQGREGGEEGGASGTSPASGQAQRPADPATRADPRAAGPAEEGERTATSSTMRGWSCVVAQAGAPPPARPSASSLQREVPAPPLLPSLAWGRGEGAPWEIDGDKKWEHATVGASAVRPYSALGPGGAPPPGAGRPSPPPRPLSSRSPRRAASLTAAPNPRRGTASPPRLQSIFATTVEEKGAPLFNLPWRRTRAEEGGLPRAATPHRGGHRRCTYTSWLRGRLPPRLLDPR
jgi:hypothetical protein